MYTLNKTISFGENKILFAVYPDQDLDLGEYDGVIGVGASLNDAIESFLGQMPEMFLVDHGEDWDDPHDWRNKWNYRLSDRTDVCFGEYIYIYKETDYGEDTLDG